MVDRVRTLADCRYAAGLYLWDFLAIQDGRKSCLSRGYVLSIPNMYFFMIALGFLGD